MMERLKRKVTNFLDGMWEGFREEVTSDLGCKR